MSSTAPIPRVRPPAERVRQNSDYDEIVLIALTGWGQEEDRQRTKAAGFNHHLVKPANIAELQELLAGGA